MIRGDRFDDGVAELINIGVGRAAASLSAMVNEPIMLSVPKLITIPADELWTRIGVITSDTISLVQQGFEGQVAGTASLLFPADSARKLVDMLTEGALNADELDLEREAALMEVGNILINGVMGTIGNITGLEVAYQLPEYLECAAGELGSSLKTRELILAVVLISISGKEVYGHLILLFDLEALDTLALAIDRMSGEPD